MPTLWRWTPLLLLPASIHAQHDCSRIRDGDVRFNFESLGGPKTVHSQEWVKLPPTIFNTTYTIDICNNLPMKSKTEDCSKGTRVCAKQYLYRKGIEEPVLDSVSPIAGEFTGTHGTSRALNPKYTRLNGSASNSDGKIGLLMELHGGYDDRLKRSQKAIIEFLCDKKLTGNEGFEASADKLESVAVSETRRRADSGDEDDEGDDKSPKLPNLDKGKSLQFVSFRQEDSTQVLRLRWKTKHACETSNGDGGGSDDGDDKGDKGGDDKGGSDSDKPSKDGSGWGFFTWFIIIVFLLIAAYIIFGSWLNYNRYGARGWDLIPHGDAIRDMPYIVKDWGSNVMSGLKGGDSRGGYSAV